MGALGPALVAVAALLVTQAGPTPPGDVPDAPPGARDRRDPVHWEPTALAADTSTATSSTATSRPAGSTDPGPSPNPTADDPDLLGEDPLSDEDLALLAALDARTATTSTHSASLSATWWLVPEPLPRSTILVPRARLRDAIGRTLGESLDVLPTITDTSRRWIPHDTLVVRGQSGHRVAMTIDGIPLRHALSQGNDTTGASLIDPWMIDTVMIERPRSIGVSPHGSAATITLASAEPRTEPGVGVEAEVAARTADRSTSTHAAAEGTTTLGGLRVAAGYGDFRATRISGTTGGRELGDPYQRINASARGRLFGRSTDAVRVVAGVDLDRLLNVARTDVTHPNTREEENERVLAFARADVGDAKLGGSALFSRQSFALTRSYQAGGREDEEATSYFGRAAGHLELFPGMIARAGLSFETSSGSLTRAWSGDVESTELFLGAEVDVEDASAYGVVALVGTDTALSSPYGDEEASAFGVLTQAGLRVRVVGPLAVRGGYSEGRYVPTVADLAHAPRALKTERSKTAELGPSLFTRDGFFELLGFYTRIDDAIEPVVFSSEELHNVDGVDLFGLEVVGGLVLRDHIRLAGALTWTEARDVASDAPLVTLPTITGRASVRYELRTRRAFVEAHVRGTTEPLHVTSLSVSGPSAALAALAPSTFATVGLTGATDLGRGLRLGLSIENVLDTSHRAPMNLVPGAGIDVRASLSWAWE